MTEELVMNLTDKKLVTDAVVLHVAYDSTALSVNGGYTGVVKTNYYGQKVPKSAHGTAPLGSHTASMKRITRAVADLYRQIVDPSLPIRRVAVTAINTVEKGTQSGQMSLFDRPREDTKEDRLRQSMLSIQKKFGKNSLLKGHDLKDGATKKQRNRQIGGHKA